MRNYNALRYLKKTLSCCIDELDSVRSLFVKNPETDFTRNRAISFPDTFWLLLGLQAKSMSNEILDFCDHSGKIPTSSAFIQQRHKNTYYKMSFRVVRFKTAGGYACVATNLSDKTFTTAMIKQLYIK